MSSQKEKARALLSLHRGPNIFVLPNAWDASSARLFELAGFPAIATTSGGIAALFGYPDGQKVPPALMLAMVGRIAQSVSAPVTADLEAGYGTSIEEVAGTVKEAIAQGIVGMNFEDSTRRTEQPLAEIGYQTDLIKGIRAVGEKMDVPIVLNARVDPYLIASMDESTRFKEAVQRGNAYRSAGADSIFVIGVSARETIRQLVREIDAPINIMAGAGSPSIAELEQLGVARVSFGTGPMRAILPLVQKMAVNLRTSGDFELMKQSAFSHAAVNQMFSR